jgi:hypothetical protein
MNAALVSLVIENCKPGLTYELSEGIGGGYIRRSQRRQSCLVYLLVRSLAGDLMAAAIDQHDQMSTKILLGSGQDGLQTLVIGFMKDKIA